MKANELMIGDWVHVVEPCKYAGATGRVKTLIDHKDDENAYFKVFLKNNTIHIGIEDICSDDIRPIPLTPEILEKNGIKLFCTEPSGRKTYCCNEPVVQCTYIPNSGWLISVGACGSIKARFVEISKTQYVHELQHALRLCGIEKEIIL